jgi:hypothetical protein
MVWPNHWLPHLWHSMEPSTNSVSTLDNVSSSFINQFLPIKREKGCYHYSFF